jgi:ABC-2 type transport system permease protein
VTAPADLDGTVTGTATGTATIGGRTVARGRHFRVERMLTVTRTDLRSLFESKDFWIPMVLLGGIFFLVIPTALLLLINSIGNVGAIQQLSDTMDALPKAAQDATAGMSPSGRVSYTLAVFLFAPIAVVVPLTISTAVGASTIVGERERGTGEFLAHSPADVREIYAGKLLASLIPGYLTTVVGFGLYALLVNLIAAPTVGYWFFPTPSWWLLIGWVLPPFLVIALSLVLRLSAKVKSTAAAQQGSGLVTFPLILIAYAQSTGALVGGSSTTLSLVLGAVAWMIAVASLAANLKAVTRGRLLGVADES